MPKRILLVDYPHPDGEARAAALRSMGFELRVFDMVGNRVWPGTGQVRSAVSRLVRPLRPLYALAGALQRRKLNSDLVVAVREFRPDIVLVIKGDRIGSSTYAELRKAGDYLMINWFGDSVLAPEKCAFVAANRSNFDHFFLIDDLDGLPKEVLDGIKAYSPGIKTLPLAANSDFFRPDTPQQEKRVSLADAVAFVGVVNPARKEVLSQLSGFDLRIWAPKLSPWGPWLEKKGGLEACHQGEGIFGKDLARVYSGAGVLLDIHYLYPAVHSITNVTMRVYEVPAAGGFVLTNNCRQISRLFDVGKEMVCYDGVEDLKEKISYYLSHPQERALIAERGRERVLRDHTYVNRFREMLGPLGLLP